MPITLEVHTFGLHLELTNKNGVTGYILECWTQYACNSINMLCLHQGVSGDSFYHNNVLRQEQNEPIICWLRVSRPVSSWCSQLYQNLCSKYFHFKSILLVEDTAPDLYHVSSTLRFTCLLVNYLWSLQMLLSIYNFKIWRFYKGLLCYRIFTTNLELWR